MAIPKQRAALIRNICKYPIVAVTSQDQDHWNCGEYPQYDVFRDEIRATNPQIKMLAHLNATESHQASSPGSRVIWSAGGEYGFHGHEPQDRPGTIWYEKPKGRVIVRDSGWGPKAMMDFRLKRAQDTLYSAMVTQYTGGYSRTGNNRRWDGVYLDQLIVPGSGWGTSITERQQMVVGLQSVLTRFRSRYPDAIVVCNSSRDYADINGEMNEGRADEIREVASYWRHSQPEINVYMFKPVKEASEAQISAELMKAMSYGAFFSYHYGENPYTSSPWPATFTRLLDSYPAWKELLASLALI